MITTVSNNEIINTYWAAIKNAPSDVKLKLISLLSNSLMESDLSNSSIIASKEKLLKDVTGSWKGPESAEEIINIIREKRTCRPPVNI